MFRTGPGALVISALLLLGAPGLSGCGVTVSMDDIAAREELLDDPAWFDPTYESIFIDPPYRFEPSGGSAGDADFRATGTGEPGLYPPRTDDAPAPGMEESDLPPEGERTTGAERPGLSPNGEP